MICSKWRMMSTSKHPLPPHTHAVTPHTHTHTHTHTHAHSYRAATVGGAQKSRDVILDGKHNKVLRNFLTISFMCCCRIDSVPHKVNCVLPIPWILLLHLVCYTDHIFMSLFPSSQRMMICGYSWDTHTSLMSQGIWSIVIGMMILPWLHALMTSMLADQCQSWLQGSGWEVQGVWRKETSQETRRQGGDFVFYWIIQISTRIQTSEVLSFISHSIIFFLEFLVHFQNVYKVSCLLPCSCYPSRTFLATSRMSPSTRRSWVWWVSLLVLDCKPSCSSAHL